MCKAVQHLFACGYLGHGLTVVFLIKEKAGLLPVLHIYLVLYAVFGYPGDRGGRLGQIISQVPALASIQTLELTDSYVVALEYAGNVYAFLCELLYELAVYGILYPFHTYGENLRDEDVFIAVYGKAGQPVRLAEYQAAAVIVSRAHYGPSVCEGVLYPAGKELISEGLVCV